MADIHFIKKHSFSRPEAVARILPSMRRAADSFGLKLRWVKDVCHFDGPARGFLAVGDDTIELRARLSFMAGLMKHDIEAEITAEITKVLK